jgi:uncharacterized protein (DUF433 family)
MEYIHFAFSPAGGRCDLAAYFLRRDFDLISRLGFVSLITTNSINRGETRDGGLEQIQKRDGNICFAQRSIQWPGQAAVEVTLISVTKRPKTARVILDNTEVDFIDSFLSSENLSKPFVLRSNDQLAFQGTNIYGKGFILSQDEAKSLKEKDHKNKDVIQTYLTGDEINNNPNHYPERFVVNFWNRTLEEARAYEDCIKIVEERVKPERDKVNRDRYKNVWWQFGEKCENLYKNTRSLRNVVVLSRVTKFIQPVIVENKGIFSDATVVFKQNTFRFIAYLNTTYHYEWCNFASSALASTIRYNPSDCVSNFPFPQNINSQNELQLETVGETYHGHRKQLMLAMQLGLTKTYNAFHAKEMQPGITTDILQSMDKKSIEKEYGKEVWNLWHHLQKMKNPVKGEAVNVCSIEEAIASIVKLRELHVHMDNAVLDAYGWGSGSAQPIELKHDFYEVDYLPENDRIRYTIHPDARKEVLKRLLELNHQIHEEEQTLEEANKIIKKKPSKISKTKILNTQLLFPMRPETAYGAIYSVQDIAQITKISSSTIKRWFNRLYKDGYEGISKDNSSGDQPLLLNFYGVHELIVIYDLRVKNKIPLKDILDARKWLIEKFGNKPNFYPFTSQPVLDTISKAGKQIIFTDQKTGDFITLGKGNSQLNLEFIKDILKRIVFDKGMVSRLYLSDSHLIAIDPNLAGGRPCTVENAILLDSIKSVYKESKDIKYIANAYEISESTVEDALKFEQASALN